MWHGWSRPDRDGETKVPPASARRIARYFTPYWGRTGLALSGLAITSLLGLASPLLVKALVDSALPSTANPGGDMGLLGWIVAAMLGAALVSGLVSVGQGYLNSYVSFHIMYDMRRELYASLQRQPLRFFTDARSGEMTTRVTSDVAGIEGVISGTLMSLVRNVFVVGSTLAVMLSMSWQLTLVVLLMLPVMVLPTQRVGKLRQRVRAVRQQRVSEMQTFIQETLSISGALLIKAFAREKTENTRFQAKAKDVMDINIRETVIGRWFWMGLGLVPTISVALVYLFGGRAIIDGAVTLGTVLAFIALLNRIYGPANDLATMHVDIMSSLVHFGRIFQYLDMKPDIEDAPDAKPLPPATGRIEFDHVTFGYVPGRSVLHDVSFTIEPGQLAALVGPTGAGKTTVTNLVPRFYDVTSGAMRIDSHDVRDITLESLRSQIGMVTQETFLFHASVRDNLMFARADATEDEVIAACKAAHIHDMIAQLPKGYDTVVGERGYRLSGGEKQRLAIARVLLKRPPVFILDEATSSLDSQSERRIQAALEPLMKGRTSLVIAHRLSTILAADVILVIDHGRLVEQGTHAELLARGGLYATLYEEQFRPRAMAALAETASDGA